MYIKIVNVINVWKTCFARLDYNEFKISLGKIILWLSCSLALPQLFPMLLFSCCQSKIGVISICYDLFFTLGKLLSFAFGENAEKSIGI